MTEKKHPRLLILGAGAVGLALAGALSARAEVHAVCREYHAAAIQRNGLIMEGVWGDCRAGNIVYHTKNAGFFPDFDYVFITAQAYDTGAICAEYSDLIRGRPVISIQNGIGNEETIANFTRTVIGGTVTTNFTLLGSGHVFVQSQSAPMKLGIFSTGEGVTKERVLRGLIGLIADAGIRVEESYDIRADIWVKSLLNITVNPLGAILGVCVGESTDVDLWKIVSGVVREAFAVAAAEGVALPWKSAEDYLMYLHDVLVPDFAAVYTSMYYDFKNRRRTEIDVLNGYIVRKGLEHEISTPYNSCITSFVRYLQKQE
jgi:2-dehydropantoate 2-reductase